VWKKDNDTMKPALGALLFLLFLAFAQGLCVDPVPEIPKSKER
jgi:hypothetical protein